MANNWTEICAKCMDGDIEPHHCEYYGEPNGCNSPTYGEHPPTPNAAAMYSCLLKILAEMIDLGGMEVGRKVRFSPNAIADEIRQAFAVAPRNCDKYENDNAIEQFEREILGKEAATTYERLENMRENWFRYNSWLFEKAKERRGDESPRTGQEGE